MNRQSAFATLLKATKKVTQTAGPSLETGQNVRPDSAFLAARFIKSQSSCSLERKDTGQEDAKEDFLRPLNATVMHDYVSRRMSHAAVSQGALSPSKPDSVDGGPAAAGAGRELVCHTNWESAPQSLSCGRADVDIHWDLSANNDPAVTIRFSLRFLTRFCYFL